MRHQVKPGCEPVVAPSATEKKLDNLIAVPRHWQRPAATEEAAYNSILRRASELDLQYYGVPWATVIDGIHERSPKAHDILFALRNVHQDEPTCHTKRCTVAQHIRALEYIYLFEAIGITDLFWSHATNDLTEFHGMRIHPFPLFPAQASSYQVSETSEKRHLANFVGAFNPKIYLSNVREIIFGDTGTAEDLLIIKRERWHFDRAVYDEQIHGSSASDHQLEIEEQMKQEYVDAIKQSWFTLCPTGSGPNSIRIFESLMLGSIPIILTNRLNLPGPHKLWRDSCIIEEDSELGYRRALDVARDMSLDAKTKMLNCGKALATFIDPVNYANIIIDQVNS
ncbi:MAG: exostosin family protein [Pseudomonadota bacterium]